MTGSSNSDLAAQLARIEAQLGALADKVDTHNRAVDEWRARTSLTLHGDGNGNRGMSLRLGLLEQSAERSRWAGRALAVAVLGLLGQAVAKLLGR